MKRFLPALVLLLAACGGEEHSAAAEMEHEAAPHGEAAHQPDSHGTGGHDAGDSHEEEDPASGLRPADGVYPFQGTWANPWSDCTLEPGSSTDAPILIEGSTFTGYENTCGLYEVEALNAAGTRYRLERRCVGDGSEYAEVVDMRVSGDTLTMTTGIGDVTWARCTLPEHE